MNTRTRSLPGVNGNGVKIKVIDTLAFMVKSGGGLLLKPRSAYMNRITAKRIA